MVIGRLRRTLKRGLSIAMAAALMVTSVPQLSVSSMAQEEQKSAQNEGTDEYASESAEQDGTEGKSQSGDSAENASTEEEYEDSEETRETDAEQSEGEDGSEESETDTDAGEDDKKEPEQDQTEEESETAGEEEKVSDSDYARAGEDEIEGKLIYENDFNSASEGDTSIDVNKKGTVVELANGNMALEYDVPQMKETAWEEAFTASLALEQAYETRVKEKLTISYDIYFPNGADAGDINVGDEARDRSISGFGTMKVQTVLNNGDKWDWLSADSYPEFTVNDLESDNIDGYSKIHICEDIIGNKEEDNAWDFTDLSSLRGVTIKVVGDTSNYKGKLYLDNVVLKDTSPESGDDDLTPPGDDDDSVKGDLIYENNFDSLDSLDGVINVGEGETAPPLMQLSEGNKAVKYSAKLSGADWENIFNAQFNLSEPYEKTITDKVVMSYDVYFPENDVNDSVFDSMKAQAALSCGDWVWVSQRSCPEYTMTNLVDDDKVTGYKKVHVEIDMNDFVADGEDYPLDQITPIRAVIPCFAGSGSKYEGDLFLDNLEVRAVGTKEEPGSDLEESIIFEGSQDADEDGLAQVMIQDTDFNMEKVVEGGYFYVEYQSEAAQEMNLALSEWDTKTWAEVTATESGTTESGLYYAKYSFAKCASAYGKDDMSDVDALSTKAENAEYTLKCIKWYGPKIDIKYQLLYKGSSTVKGSSNGPATYFYTKHVGGDFDNTALDKGSYFTLEYTSTIDADTDQDSSLTIALSSVSDTDNDTDNHWVAVNPSTTSRLDNGNYLSTYRIEDCVKAFGSNLNRLDQVQVYTSYSTAEDAEFELKEMKYYPGNGERIDPNGETKWTNKRTTGVGFIGDSICQNAMLLYKNWNTILDRADCVDTNWGIGGQNTTQISRRIDDMLEAADYEKIVVLCGINDLGHGITKDQYIDNYTTIINKIHVAQPETEIYAISILPTTPDFYADQQTDIRERNTALKALTEEYDYVTYVDCHSEFYDESTGYCKADYVSDGLHPNENGYRVIAEVLNPVLGESEPNNPDNPDGEEDIIYENNFDNEQNADIVAEADGKTAELATLADGNKAVRFTTDLSASSGWTDIFKAQIDLPEEYAEPISDKVVMSYDVYFPVNSIKEDFGTIKAQAALKSGADWTWISQKSWPSVEAGGLEESVIPGYKVFHVEIDMNDFQTWNGSGNVDYPFEAITPIHTVIPCLAGEGSKYVGDVYLDNLVVKAVNTSGELPPVEGDLALDLSAESWSVTAGYQYTGKSTIRNESVGDGTFLVFNMDYSNDATQGWSEGKFDYTHPGSVDTLSGYNAFKADIYYKPADKTAGSFGIKLFSNSPTIDKDAALSAGEPADILELAAEGYYKAEYVLELRIPTGAFQSLTLGFVGKNTDFKGDIYLANMRFTQVVAEDIYVDSTIEPKKGKGIQVVDDGRSIQTASGNKIAIAEEVALVDASANEATKNLYAYLKAVGESDSVIFGHQNDTHHKAGSEGDGFSNSDTEDVTGSIAGVIGIDSLSLTGNEASTWDTPEADRIATVAAITREAAAKGALVTLSAHMPNFDVIDKRVKAYEESGKTGTDSDSVGYWEVNGDRQYNFSGYTPGTLTGNVVTRIMPGQDLNYLYTDYLDLIADYAKAVEGDGITILFRPLHENTGSWFWWGAALCDEQAYINLYRYTVDYLKETKGVHNMLYVYGPGSEAANAAEYGARYPGDDYVDMIGYDLYHQGPSPENEDGYLQSISKQNAILKEFAEAHGKLYAITETGVADKDATGEDIALQRTGNKVMDWYMQLLEEISDDGVCYFLVWANFSENGSFYLPYVVEKKENGVLHGHEMMDEFIKFYNDDRSVFATDMNSGFKQVSGVTNTTKEDVVSGYITAPLSGDRILPGKEDKSTRIAARVTGVDKAADVRFVVETEFDQVILKASYNEEQGIWEAVLKDSALLSLGEALGTISLFVGENEIAKISAKFNMEVPVQDDMLPEDFEGYNGDSQQLGLVWATNKASGSEITFSLTDDPEKVFGGEYGLKMDVTFAASDAWAGATKALEADWSAGNALEFYTVPETMGQKVVVQVTAGGQIFEVYLQEYAIYTENAANGFPVKVTIPFSAFVGRDSKDAKFDPGKVESIGLWCNAIAKEGLEFPLSTTLYYDEFKIVTTDNTAIEFEALAKKGIWIKAIPDQTYTGKAIKPDVQVYDDAKLLTPKKDYTVTYKNNIKSGMADVIIKGKGNYSESIKEHFRIVSKNVSELTITAPDYLIYNGREQNIAVVVKDGNKKLSTKNDYDQEIIYTNSTDDGTGQNQDVTVQKAKEEGTYSIKITMKESGNYAGETILTCKMVKDKELLSKATVTLPSRSLDYQDGEEVRFDESQIVVKLKGKVIPQQEADGTVNYKIAYENHRQVGTASVVVSAGENSKYVGSVRKTFDIKGKTFSAKTIDISGFNTKVLYTGKSVFQNPVLKDKASGSAEPLEKNVDYRITYTNNVNAGKAAMTLTGLGKYSGTIKKTFTIDKVELKADMVQKQELTVQQSRAGVTPDVEIIFEGKALVRDRDYKLTYTNNKNTTSEAKRAYISIAGVGNFKGSLKNAVELKIEPKSWDSGEITVEVADMKYGANKAKYTPVPTVYDNGVKLTKNKDYTVVEYKSNTKEEIGAITDEGHTAEVIIQLNGTDYVTGEAGESKSFTFKIIGKLISETKVKLDPNKKQYFSQYGTRPDETDLIVTYKNNPVTTDEYKIISYSANDKKGKATLVIEGRGTFGGTKKVTYKIEARGLNTNLAEAADSMKDIMSTLINQLQ